MICDKCGEPYWLFHSKKQCKKHYYITSDGVMHLKPKRYFESEAFKETCRQVSKVRQNS